MTITFPTICYSHAPCVFSNFTLGSDFIIWTCFRL